MIFEIKERDFIKVSNWNKNHKCTIPYSGALGGKLTYTFTPTNIDTIIKVKCACGKELDLTDYTNW